MNIPAADDKAMAMAWECEQMTGPAGKARDLHKTHRGRREHHTDHASISWGQHHPPEVTTSSRCRHGHELYRWWGA